MSVKDVLKKGAGLSMALIKRLKFLENGILLNGTKVTVLGTKGSFYKIDCYDMIGYVAKMQVAYDKDGISYICCIPNASETAFLPVFSAEEAAIAANSSAFGL